MFKQFNEEARQAVVLSQEESRLLNHNYIGTEHLLLGLLAAENSVAAQVLTGTGVDKDQLRDQVVAIIGQGSEEVSGHIPFTARAKKIFELSLRESIELGHDYIGSEHLLLGLLREGEGVAAQVLNHLGVELEPVRVRVVEMVGMAEVPLPEHPAPSPPGTSLVRHHQDPALVSVVFVLVALLAVQIQTPTPEITRWGLALLLGGVLLWVGGGVIGMGTQRGTGRYLRLLGGLTLAAAASVFVLGALFA